MGVGMVVCRGMLIQLGICDSKMTQAVAKAVNASVKQLSAIPGPPSWPIIGSSLMYR